MNKPPQQPSAGKVVLDKKLEKTIGEDAFKVLEGMKAEDLISILTHLFESRTANVTPSRLLEQLEVNRFLPPSPVPQSKFVEFDTITHSLSDPDIRFLELSPLAVLGSNSVLAHINQKRVVATNRNAEVMADTVTTLMLECARERKQGNASPLHLATSHREVRAQKYEEGSGFLPHFRTVSLVSAEKKSASEEEQLSSLLYKHMSFYLKFVDTYAKRQDGHVKDIVVRISSLRILERVIKHFSLDREALTRETYNPGFDLFSLYGVKLPGKFNPDDVLDENAMQEVGLTRIIDRLKRVAEPVLQKLSTEFPNFRYEFDLARVAGMGYYDDLCFSLYGTNGKGEEVSLADGGFVDWMKRLTMNRDEVAITSGFGTELFLSKFVD